MATSCGADRIKHQDHLRKVATAPTFTTVQPFNNSNNSDNNNNNDNNKTDNDHNQLYSTIS